VNFANAPIPEVETPETVRADSLRMLGELAGIGMAVARSLQDLAALELARAMQAQTVWTPPGAAPARPAQGGTDIALSLSRVARTVRLTLAMRGRLVSQPAQAAAPAAPRAPVDAQAAEESRRERRRLWNEVGKTMVRDGVERAIAAEARGEQAERLRAELHERLEDPDELAEFDGLMFGEIIVRVCKDLGLDPQTRLERLRRRAREAAGESEPDPPPNPSSPAPVPATHSVTAEQADLPSEVNRRVHGMGRRDKRGDDGWGNGDGQPP